MAKSKAPKTAPQRALLRDREVTVPAILAAAEIEFATHGFSATRTESIAVRANVVKGLIFHYFHSKDNLYLSVLERAYAPFNELLRQPHPPGLSAREELLDLVEKLLAAMADSPMAPLLFMLESIQGQGENFRKLEMPALYKGIEKLLAKGVAAGDFRPMDCWHAAINIVALCGFYFCAANNLAQIPRSGHKPLEKAEIARHAREVLALVAQGFKKQP